jgi:hypothetical protein
LLSGAAANGYFILSHVPRAYITPDFDHNHPHSHVSTETTMNGAVYGAPIAELLDHPTAFKLQSPLEQILVKHAAEFQLQLHTILRPCNVSQQDREIWAAAKQHDTDNMLVDLEEMDDAGVCILVFVQTSS